MHIFHINFLNALGVLAQEIYDVHALFHQFSNIKNGRRFQQWTILSQLVSAGPKHTGMSHPKEN